MKETDSRFCKVVNDKCECGKQGKQILRCLKPFSADNIRETMRAIYDRAKEAE